MARLPRSIRGECAIAPEQVNAAVGTAVRESAGDGTKAERRERAVAAASWASGGEGGSQEGSFGERKRSGGDWVLVIAGHGIAAATLLLLVITATIGAG